MILHTVNKSPFTDSSLKSCIRCSTPGQSILLIEDGVYAALNDTETSALIKELDSSVTVYALKEDLAARGILSTIMTSIKLIDYEGFVDLTLSHSAVQSWH